ncbi:MAG: hypothetical protein M3362_25025 [Acidobacteriota bacterium]|nr:hypothetical protein [Acidobacteriota bacterium]
MTKHYPALSGSVFDKDSPFCRLPYELDSTQRRFLEGIRFAIEMAQVSSLRLRETLAQLSLSNKGEQDIADSVAVTVFLDAWSVVDSIHRLRELLQAMPKMKKRGVMLELFMRGTAQVVELRNHIQHLREELPRPDSALLPVWGTLSWLFVLDTSLTRFLSGNIVAGYDVGSNRLILSPGNRTYHDQLDHITLSADSNQANLSEMMRLVVRIGRGLEKSLKPQLEGHDELSLLDSLLLLEIEWLPNTEDSTTNP